MWLNLRQGDSRRCLRSAAGMFVLLSETLGKFSSPGVAVYQCEALEYCSLADSLSMKSTPEESRAQEGAGREAADPGSCQP